MKLFQFIKNSLQKIFFRFRYPQNVFEKEVLPIRMSEEKFQSKQLKEFRKDVLSFSIKGKDDIFKYLFYLFTLVLLIALPLMSIEVGVSEKELGQQQMAEQFFDSFAHHQPLPADAYANDHPQMVDFLCVCISKWLNFNNIYQFRHIIGAIFAWLIILLTGCFLMKIFNWRAAFLGTLLLFISPHFLAQSFGNVADISFAFFYLFGIYEIYLFTTEFPVIKWKRLILLLISTLCAVSVQRGGFILLHYFFIIAILTFLLNNPIRKIFTHVYGVNFLKLMGIVLATIACVYLLDFFHPFHFLSLSTISPAEALLQTTDNLPVTQFLWEGVIVSSDTLSLGFLFKKLQITVPLVVILGCIVHLIFLRTIIKECRLLNTILLYFALLYPLWNLSGTVGHLGDGWAIYLIIYPLVIMAAAAGYHGFLRRVDDRYTNSVIVGGILLLSFLPLRHLLVNQPCAGVYYNELSGGIHQAVGRYEIDNNESINRRACKWLHTHIVQQDTRYQVDTLPQIEIGTDGRRACAFFFSHDSNRVHLSTTPFATSDSLAWDYYLSFIDQVSSPTYLEQRDTLKPLKIFTVNNLPVAAIFAAPPKPVIDTLPTSIPDIIK